MVTNVTSLLKTVKAVEDEATKGTRALEATTEHIRQELAVSPSVQPGLGWRAGSGWIVNVRRPHMHKDADAQPPPPARLPVHAALSPLPHLFPPWRLTPTLFIPASTFSGLSVATFRGHFLAFTFFSHFQNSGPPNKPLFESLSSFGLCDTRFSVAPHISSIVALTFNQINLRGLPETAPIAFVLLFGRFNPLIIVL